MFWSVRRKEYKVLVCAKHLQRPPYSCIEISLVSDFLFSPRIFCFLALEQARNFRANLGHQWWAEVSFWHLKSHTSHFQISVCKEIHWFPWITFFQDVEGLQPPELPLTSGRCLCSAHGRRGRPSFRGKEYFQTLINWLQTIQVRQWEASVTTGSKSVVKRSPRTVNSFQEIPATTFTCAAQVLLTIQPWKLFLF